MSQRALMLTSYGELLRVLDDLPVAMRSLRRVRGLSIRAAAEEIGVSFSCLDRFEHCQGAATLTTLRAILRWFHAQTFQARFTASLSEDLTLTHLDSQPQERTKEGEA